MADDAVVAAAKRGDPDAWRTLHRAHAGRLVVWLRTRPTGDTSASPEDVAGEAWYVAARKIADFTGTSADFGGWLFGIARRLSATARRTSERRGTRPGEAPEELQVVDEPQLLVDQDAWVRDLLGALPPRERAAVGLVDGLGVSLTQAAEILDCSVVSVRVARHRGLRRLRGHAEVTATQRDHAPGPAPAT